MERAVVFSDERTLGVLFRGQIVVSYPRKIWEPTREEDGVRYWSSRERTSVELFELTYFLHSKVKRINDRHRPAPRGSGRAIRSIALIA
jgi:hypothetical protein